MNKQGKNGIEWCDYTWNPVTGCLHGCEYCYARRIANRFKGFECRCGGEEIPEENRKNGKNSIWNTTHGDNLHVFSEQPMKRINIREFQKASYPYGFEPTFHRYRLDEPQKLKKPSKIFAVSMGDLFGDWMKDERIKAVFEACNKAHWHKYLFLTKNPKRYGELNNGQGVPDNPNFWYGSTITNAGDIFACAKTPRLHRSRCFVSIEPLLEAPPKDLSDFAYVDWVIVGAETGNRKGKVIPKPEWVQTIIDECRRVGTPVFLKDNLHWPEKIQEFPEGLKI